MYIHIGGDVSVLSDEIVGVMDIENTSTSKITKEFLRSVGKSVINVSDDFPRTFVITKEKEEVKVYISPVSSSTIYKRVKDISYKNTQSE